MKHTAEPWGLKAGRTFTQLETGNFIGYYGRNSELSTISAYEADLNAQRICTCVNALEGIDDPAAFRAAYRELQEAAVSIIVDMTDGGLAYTNYDDLRFWIARWQSWLEPLVDPALLDTTRRQREENAE